MATGWAGDGAVQDQIDATVKDGIARARSRLPRGPSPVSYTHLDVYKRQPHHRVIEQQGFGNTLQQVDQIIVAADVRQFVRNQGF